jgi:hypothetical protein
MVLQIEAGELRRDEVQPLHRLVVPVVMDNPL